MALNAVTLLPVVAYVHPINEAKYKKTLLFIKVSK